MSRTVLAIDCSQRVSHLVLATADRVHARTSLSTEPSDREGFWDELRTLFDEARCTPDTVEAVAVATGPGGFTGLRVSIAFAKAFAFARSLPVIAIPSPIVFVASDAARGGQGPWLVALAAKNATAWCTRAAEVPEGGFALEEPSVVDAGAFGMRAAAVAALGGVLLADVHLGASLVQTLVEAQLPQRPLLVDPRALAGQALRRLERGITIDPLALAPIYAREPEAVTKWRERASH